VLVEGLANAGRGVSTFVIHDSDIETGATQLFAKAFEPSLKNININYGQNVIALQTPAREVTVLNYRRMVYFAIIEKGELGEYIYITATSPDGSPLNWKIPVKICKGDTIQKLAAYSIIRDLQEGRSKYHNIDGTTPDEETKKKIKDEIIHLGVKHQLASSHTSFIAIEERDNATENTLISERVVTAPAPVPPPKIVNNFEAWQKDISIQRLMKGNSELMPKLQNARKIADTRTADAISMIDKNIHILSLARRESEESFTIGAENLDHLNRDTERFYGYSHQIECSANITDIRQNLTTLWGMTKEEILRLLIIVVLIIACFLIIYFKFIYVPGSTSIIPTPATNSTTHI